MVKTVSYDPRGTISRAREFLKVGKQKNAVQTLHSFLVLMVKRTKPWVQAHEDVMILYLNICVDMRDAAQAKDGLHQYRTISQQSTPKSLRNVVDHLIKAAQNKLQQAQNECAQKVAYNKANEIQRYSNVATLLSQVSLDTDEERLERVLVKPWVIFLWESYRGTLELLRNNQALHMQYHNLANAAYRFCHQNKCNREFKRLCDIVRKHYENIQEVNAKPDSALEVWEKTLKINGVHIDTAFVERQLLTRFAQMEHAADMDLWTEVWWTIQDIHDIMASSPRELKLKIRAEFYLKVSRVFLQAGNTLFHAYALSKYYSLSKNFNRSITSSQLAELSSNVLLATISINANNLNIVYSDENADQKNRDIAAQLNFDGEVSRDALLADILQMGILDDIPPPVQALYNCLEADFAPLQLINRFYTAIADMEKAKGGKFHQVIHLKSYKHDLEILAIVRLLEHLSSVYDKFTVENFASLISSTSIAFSEVETIIARQCSQVHTGVNVQIDHQNKTLNFHSGGPEGERMHAQLATLSIRLQDVVSEFEPSEYREARANIQANFFHSIRENAPAENMAMQGRQNIIEDLKVEKEKQKYIVQQQKKKAAKVAAEKNAAAIRESLEVQKRRREERKQALADIEAQRKAVRAYAVQQLGVAKAKELVKEIGNALSREEVDSAMEVVQKKKLKDDHLKDKKKQALRRHLDYSTRAVREEEIARGEKYYKELAVARLSECKERIAKEYAVKRKRWEDLREKKREIIHLRDSVGSFHSELLKSRWEEMRRQRQEQNHLKRAQARMREAIESQQKRRLLAIQAAEEEAEEQLRQEAAEAAAAEQQAHEEAERAAQAELEAQRAAEEKARNRYVPPSQRGMASSPTGPGAPRPGFGGERFNSGGDRFNSGGDHFNSGDRERERERDRFPSRGFPRRDEHHSASNGFERRDDRDRDRETPGGRWR